MTVNTNMQIVSKMIGDLHDPYNSIHNRLTLQYKKPNHTEIVIPTIGSIASFPHQSGLSIFSPAEQDVLRRLFRQYGFNTEMCLYDLLAFDMYKSLLDLNKKCESQHLKNKFDMTKIADRFCREYLVSEIGMMCRFSNQVLTEAIDTRWLGNSQSMQRLLSAIPTTLRGMHEIERNKNKNGHPSLCDELNIINQNINIFEQTSNLLTRLLQTPEGQGRLFKPLSSLEAEAIEKGAKKTLADLIEYLNFILRSQLQYEKAGLRIPPNHKDRIREILALLEKLAKQLSDAGGTISNAAREDFAPLVGKIKRWRSAASEGSLSLLERLRPILLKLQEMQNDYNDARFLAELNHQDAPKTFNERYSIALSHLTAEANFLTLIYFIGELVENRILNNQFICSSKLFERMRFVYLHILNPEVTCALPACNEDISEIEQTLRNRITPLLDKIKAYLHEKNEIATKNRRFIEGIASRNNEGSEYYTLYQEDCGNWHSCIEIRQEIAKALSTIKQDILQTIPQPISEEDKTALAALFFKYGTPFVFPLLFFSDVEAFVTCNVEDKPTEHVLPAELADFMILDTKDFPGEEAPSIESIPSDTSANTPPSVEPDTGREGKLTDTSEEDTGREGKSSDRWESRLTRREQQALDRIGQREPRVRPSMDPNEKVRLNHKRRKLETQLRQMGFIETDLGKGSHRIYESQDGKKVLVSRQSSQKQGTVHGMEAALNNTDDKVSKVAENHGKKKKKKKPHPTTSAS